MCARTHWLFVNAVHVRVRARARANAIATVKFSTLLYAHTDIIIIIIMASALPSSSSSSSSSRSSSPPRPYIYSDPEDEAFMDNQFADHAKEVRHALCRLQYFGLLEESRELDEATAYLEALRGTHKFERYLYRETCELRDVYYTIRKHECLEFVRELETVKKGLEKHKALCVKELNDFFPRPIFGCAKEELETCRNYLKPFQEELERLDAQLLRQQQLQQEVEERGGVAPHVQYRNNFEEVREAEFQALTLQFREDYERVKAGWAKYPDQRFHFYRLETAFDWPWNRPIVFANRADMMGSRMFLQMYEDQLKSLDKAAAEAKEALAMENNERALANLDIAANNLN